MSALHSVVSILKLLVALGLVVAGLALVSWLVAFGPFGWILIAIAVGLAYVVFKSGQEDDDVQESTRHCPGCGARVNDAVDTCEYCSATIGSGPQQSD